MSNSTDLNKTLDSQIDEILDELYSEGIHNIDGKRGKAWSIGQARSQLLALIQTVGEGLIGEDEMPGREYLKGVPGVQRDALRAEQRKTLKDLIGENR